MSVPYILKGKNLQILPHSWAMVQLWTLGESGSTSNTMSPGPRLTSVPSGILIYPAVWPQRTWAENWGAVPPFFGALPHLRQCGLGRDLPPSQVSSRSIQLFGHNTPALQTDRQTGQQSDSIGRTVLQTVAQKWLNHSRCRLGFWLGWAQGTMY